MCDGIADCVGDTDEPDDCDYKRSFDAKKRKVEGRWIISGYH